MKYSTDSIRFDLIPFHSIRFDSLFIRSLDHLPSLFRTIKHSIAASTTYDVDWISVRVRVHSYDGLTTVLLLCVSVCCRKIKNHDTYGGGGGSRCVGYNISFSDFFMSYELQYECISCFSRFTDKFHMFASIRRSFIHSFVAISKGSTQIWVPIIQELYLWVAVNICSEKVHLFSDIKRKKKGPHFPLYRNER